MADPVQPGRRSSGAPPAPASVAPGALTALLADLVRAPDHPARKAPAPGVVIGRFELVRPLGAGGFGVVWEARDRQLGRTVAFKLIRPGARADLRERSLLREAEAAARLSHDNLVALFDVGQSEYGPYLVMELLHGRTLAERLAAGPLARSEALRVLREAVRGVAHAHHEGVVHRDLKPANVFICDDGRVKVLDFGLAHAFGRRRQSGGTPAYMAPEQCREAPEDERTDVFALGVMAFELLAATLPFADEKATAGSEPAPALEVQGAPEVGELVARMLEKDPVDRPRDAAALLPIFDDALASLERAESSGSSARVRTRRHRRWRSVGLLGMGALLGLLGAVAIWAMLRPPARPDGRLLVAVADVINETGEGELDVLSGLLVTSLEQSKRLEVMTPSRVLDLSAQAGGRRATRVDETTGREVGRASGAGLLLLPAIRRLGATYAVELRALDPVKDVHLFTVSDRAGSKEGLFDLLDRLSERVRRELREDPAELERTRLRLGVAMTRSIEAYQHYLAGVEARQRDGLRAVALREQQKAIELDPEFAAAHAQLASAYGVYGRPDLARPHWEAADRHLDRMPEKERTLLLLYRARGSTGHPDPAEAARIADQLIERWPQDALALNLACFGYDVGTAGAFRIDRGRASRAEAALRRAVALDPGHGGLLSSLIRLLGERSPEALEVARRGVAARPGGHQLFLLSAVLAANGRPDEALVTARRALERSGTESAVVTGNTCGVLEMLGALAECIPYLRRIEAEGRNDFERDEARTALAYRLATTGQVRGALQAVAAGRTFVLEAMARSNGVDRHRPTAVALAAARRVEDPFTRRFLLAWYDDVAGAAAADAALPAEGRDPAAENMYRLLVAAAQGRRREALEAARAQVQRNQALGEVNYDAQYLLAEALLESGDDAGAAAVAGSYPDPALAAAVKVSFEGFPDLALVRARAKANLGRTEEAVRELDAILSFWREADQDLPRLIEVKALRARLAGAAR